MPARSRTTRIAPEARARLDELLDESADNEIFIVPHGKPVAALISVKRYDAFLDTLEALEEELLAERAQTTLARIPAGKEPTRSFTETFSEPQ